MKRVQSGCILQTLVFAQKEEMGYTKEQALKTNREEFEHYKLLLERSRTRHQIVSEDVREDGALVVRVRKQLNNKTDVSEYFNP